jgi:hypothetical protein
MAEETIPGIHGDADEHGRRDFLKGTLLTGAATVTTAAVSTSSPSRCSRTTPTTMPSG